MNNLSNKPKALLSDVLLIIVAIIWGAGFIATKYAINANMSADTIMFFRFSIAAILILICFFKDIIKINKNDLKIGILAGIFLFLGFFLQTIGLKYTTPSNNAFITSINVVIVPFLSWIIMKKRPSLKIFMLAGTSLLGIGVLTLSKDGGVSFSNGDFLTLMCAFFFAIHMSYLELATKRVDINKLIFIQLTTAAFFSMIIFLFNLDDLKNINFKAGMAPILYLGIVSTCICIFVQTFAQRNTTSTRAAIILSVEGVAGSAFSILVGIEILTLNMIIGGTIILVSIILMEVNFEKIKTVVVELYTNKIRK